MLSQAPSTKLSTQCLAKQPALSQAPYYQAKHQVLR